MVARRQKQILGWRCVTLTNQDIQVAELSQRNVSVGRRSENRSFPGNRRNPDLLQSAKEPRQFPRQKKIIQTMGLKITFELIQDSLGDGFRTTVSKIMTQERLHTVRCCCVDHIFPIDFSSKQAADPLRCIAIDDRPSTAE